MTRRLSLGWDRGVAGQRVPLFKEGKRAEQGLLARIARGGCDSSSCPTRTEVGDGYDGWATPVGVPGARDPPVSGGSEVERRGCWAAQRGPGAGRGGGDWAVVHCAGWAEGKTGGSDVGLRAKTSGSSLFSASLFF